MAERNVAAIRHVILYKHGIGFFKREALVEGDGVIELQFKTKEMNDVLKSLTAYDSGGGLIPSISYEGRDGNSDGRGNHGASAFDDTGLEIPADRALSGLLANLVGVSLSLKIGDSELRGEILGLETFQIGQNRQTATGALQSESRDERRLVLRTEAGVLRSVNILEVEEYRLLDEKVEQDVRHLLDSVVYWKKKAARKITIHARGSGERRVSLSYAIEAPVWKTSYRILLPGSDSATGIVDTPSSDSTRLHLQGWALIDNTHDEDWVDVRLSLVAGLPVSFTHDLYSPRYQLRPEIAVDRGVAYGAPTVPGATMPAAPQPLGRISRSAPPVAAPMASMDFMPTDDFDEVADMSPKEMSESDDISNSFSASVSVSGGELDGGNSYVYHLEHPVSVGRGQSALVPILSSDFAGSRVALYSPQIRASNPMAAILLRNTAGLTIEGGPVTIFDGESYAGEGMLKMFQSGETQFVPYAVDLGCRISIDHESIERGVYRSVIVNGSWTMYRRRLALSIYNINNQANAHPLELYLEHPIRSGWNLAGDEDMGIELDSGSIKIVAGELHEKTDLHYRFKVTVPAGEAVRFVAREIGDYSEDQSLAYMDRETLSGFAARGYLDEATRALIEELITMQTDAGELESQLRDYQSETENLAAGQERLRENLKSFSGRADEDDLRRRYLAQFKQDEDRFEAINAETSRLKDELQEISGRRNRLLARASLDLMVSSDANS